MIQALQKCLIYLLNIYVANHTYATLRPRDISAGTVASLTAPPGAYRGPWQRRRHVEMREPQRVWPIFLAEASFLGVKEKRPGQAPPMNLLAALLRLYYARALTARGAHAEHWLVTTYNIA